MKKHDLVLENTFGFYDGLIFDSLASCFTFFLKYLLINISKIKINKNKTLARIGSIYVMAPAITQTKKELRATALCHFPKRGVKPV